MKALFGALESVDEYGKSVDELELEYHEALFEYEEVAAELDEIFEEENEIITAVEQIENLITTIEEHGLSKGMVATINILEPELSEHGVFPSVETLNDVPTKDSSSEVAVESIKSLATKAWDAIKKFFIMIYNGIKKALKWILGLFSSMLKIVSNLIDKFSKSKIDDEKLNRAKVMHFAEHEIDNSLQKCWDAIDEIDESCAEPLIEVAENIKNKKDITNEESKLKTINVDLKKLVEDKATKELLGIDEVILTDDKIDIRYLPLSEVLKTTSIDLKEIVDSNEKAIDNLKDIKKNLLVTKAQATNQNKYNDKMFNTIKKITPDDMEKDKLKILSKTKNTHNTISKFNIRVSNTMAKHNKIGLKTCSVLAKCLQDIPA